MRGEPAMTCADVRPRLLDYQHGRLPAAAHADVRAHLDRCADCTHADTVEQELTLALKRRLATQWTAAPPAPSWWRRWRPVLVPAAAAAMVVLIAVPAVYLERTASHARSERAAMVGEAVNDHLRVLTSQRPLEIESAGLHDVKPWFEGRLEFAPVVAFEGDADFPLKGGAVGFFRDRKAAIFVYARRQHPISLLVFRADGLAWPATDPTLTAERGFNVMLWRRGELGYALVSDLNPDELRALAAKLTGRA
jgi:anti-sigma factor RsiW